MTESNLLPFAFHKIDEDFSFLLQCLREVLVEMGRPALAAIIPQPGVDIEGDDQALEPAEVMHLLSIVFQLLNLVEENAAAQARRRREAAGELLYEPGLWGQNLRQLQAAGFTGRQIAECMGRVHVEPVLTAHPTEAKRPTVLHIHRALYLVLVQLENQMWTPMERDDLKRQIMALLERLVRTGEIVHSKPDVRSEADNILYYLDEIFPPIIRKMDVRLRATWQEAGLDPALLADPRHYPRLSFGNWVGGDRDGHPLVTAEVTAETLARFRRHGIQIVRNLLTQLFNNLSLSAEFHPTPKSLQKRARELEALLDRHGRRVDWRGGIEPWRQYANLLLARLGAEGEAGYRCSSELAADLSLLRESLVEVGAARIAASEVVPVERILQVFGFQLAALDIRQNSAFHDRAIGELLVAAGMDDADYPNWPEEKRLAFLESELRTARPFAHCTANPGPHASAVLSCYRVLTRHIRDHSREGLGSLIVSMTRSLSDLLGVYLLAREVGLARMVKGGLACDLPVVPLFETIDDLERAPGIIKEFLRHPITRRSFAERGESRHVQQVMIGYSDSSKDGGYIASQWSLYKAQSAIAAAARAARAEVCFFHGRGGTPSRGAGPTHRFLEALPHGSLTGHFRMTEQGETIAQKYANAITATYNLELLLAGVTASTLKGGSMARQDEDFERIAQRLADFSREAYQSFIKAPGFLTYWSQATPIDALEVSFIGSRPARRTGRRSLEDLRAIPWVFSWNQSRHFLTGWFGLGSALHRLRAEHPRDFEILTRQIGRWPLLRNAFYNAETSLASASEEHINLYAGLVAEQDIRARFLDIILGEMRRTGELISAVFGSSCNQRRPRMVKTLKMREAGLRRLHRHQVQLLATWRGHLAAGHKDRADELTPAVLLSINAISAGLRTTG